MEHHPNELSFGESSKKSAIREFYSIKWHSLVSSGKSFVISLNYSESYSKFSIWFSLIS